MRAMPAQPHELSQEGFEGARVARPQERWLEYWSSRFRVAVSRMLGIVLLATLLLSRSAWADTHAELSILFLLLGWGCLGVGVVGRIWCAAHIVGKKTFSLVTEGPYSICRNPLYFFTFVGGMGAMLLTQRVSLVAAFALFFWIYYPGVMRREEASLRTLHGQRFERYRSSVPAFWPDVGGLREPESVEISPRLFRRFLFEMVWFIWLGGGIELLRDLHQSGYLAAVLALY